MKSNRDFSAKAAFAVVTLAAIVSLACLVSLAPPDGNERAQLLQFVGRFHPLSVHLPIALLMFALLLELAGRTRSFSYLLPAADFVLGAATCGAIVAAGMGWCLARSGGYSGSLIAQHMWGGIAVSGAAWLCWMLRTYGDTHSPSRIYAVALVSAVGVVSFTGYRGGQLTHGENHLTEFMPSPMSALLGVTVKDVSGDSATGGPKTFF